MPEEFKDDYKPTDNQEPQVPAMSRADLIDALMNDVVGKDTSAIEQTNSYTVANTIKDILNDYHLSTDTSFIEKIAQIKFHKTGETFTVDL